MKPSAVLDSVIPGLLVLWAGIALGAYFAAPFLLTDLTPDAWAILFTGWAAIFAAAVAFWGLHRQTTKQIEADRRRDEWQRERDAVNLAQTIRPEVKMTAAAARAQRALYLRRNENEDTKPTGHELENNKISQLFVLESHIGTIGLLGSSLSYDVALFLQYVKTSHNIAHILGQLYGTEPVPEPYFSNYFRLLDQVNTCGRTLAERLMMFPMDPKRVGELPSISLELPDVPPFEVG